MILVALDVDGTLDTSGGPVPWKLVEFLHFATPPGVVRFVVVSPSERWPGTEATGIPRMADGARRADNLKRAAAAFPWCTVRLYVSDDGDQADATEAEFDYVDPNDWPRVVGRISETAMKARGAP